MSNPEGELDEGQRSIVEATERAIVVLAGPGSGKTRTLIERARSLLSRSPAESCRLLTFTNKAAAEMAGRATALIPSDRSRILAGTYHHFAVELLRAHGHLVDVPRDFLILEADESREIRERAATRCGASSGARLGQQWSRCMLRKDVPLPQVRVFGEMYQKLKAEEAALDYDDMIVSAARLLREFDGLALAMAHRAAHLLIDEFQDTSPAQYEMVSALMRHATTVSVFADDDQAIYRFAGAERGHVMECVQRLGATVYPLDVNYRSGEAIVAASNAVLEQEVGASSRRMRAVRSGGTVECRGYRNLAAEAVGVVDEIVAILDHGGAPHEIGVLVRNGQRAEVVTTRIQRIGVPLADWRHSPTTPGRRVFAAAVAAIVGRTTAGQAERLSVALNLRATGTAGPAFLDSQRGDVVIDALAATRQELLRGRGVQDIAKGIQAAFVGRNTELAAQMVEMVDHVTVSVLHDPTYSVEHLLQDLALGNRSRLEDERGIKVATLHKTKGLQWKHVFILGAEEGVLPGRCNDAEELSDERRLFFVGVSRACDRLTMTHVGRRSLFVEDLVRAGACW